MRFDDNLFVFDSTIDSVIFIILNLKRKFVLHTNESTVTNIVYFIMRTLIMDTLLCDC